MKRNPLHHPLSETPVAWFPPRTNKKGRENGEEIPQVRENNKTLNVAI